MKHLFITTGICLLSLAVFSQTKDHKSMVSVGGSIQQYHGDLGNGFYKSNNVTYGAFNLGFDRYLNRSFDLKLALVYGDWGYCPPPGEEEEHAENGEEEVELDLSSRMFTAYLACKYKFANGYILKENSKLAPFVYVGAGFNNMQDFMKIDCVTVGSYASVNFGPGVQYNITNRLNLSYNLNFGYLNSDKVDRVRKKGNDMYMQNTFCVGFNF
ncbi:MAG: outer membrane beta-barrel protein [Bacteroidota bacterium]